MATTVRSAEARDDIATALALITAAGGYQNTVANVSKAIVHPSLVTEFPHIGFELGKSIIEVKNDARTLFDELIEVYVVGYTSANTEPTLDIASITNLQDKVESLVWDFKKNFATFFTANITNSTNSWNVVFGRGAPLVIERDTYLGNGRNLGIVKATFTIRIRHMDGSFDD